MTKLAVFRSLDLVSEIFYHVLASVGRVQVMMKGFFFVFRKPLKFFGITYFFYAAHVILLLWALIPSFTLESIFA